MNQDLELIIKRFPTEQNALRVYAIGDVHVGSPQYDDKSTRKKIKIIEEDPYACVVLAGDLGDYGLKNSKSNVYEATMNPKEQQDFIYELFKPVAHKITAAVSGNHEQRITRETGLCPLYDLCVLWGVPEVYRENLAITKYMFGSVDGREKPNVFFGVTTHGTTRNKNNKFLGGIDNADFAVSAHTHSPLYSPHGRIRIERSQNTARHVPFKEIVVDANMSLGGYSLKNQYEIAPPPELQYLELKTIRDTDYKRTMHRIINYHTITL